MRHKQPASNANKKAVGTPPALPANVNAAVHHLIRTSQALLTLTEKETQALALNDLLAFSILQHEKEKMAGDYVAASEEFRNRLEDFRAADKNLLGRLEKLQNELGERSQGNNVLVEQVYKRTQANMQKSLLAAQEYGRIAMQKESTSHREGA